MLRQLEKLKSLDVAGRDGNVGKVADVLFDDAEWTVRHIVVSTGGWLGRTVLLQPHAVSGVDDDGRTLEVNLSKEQIGNAPSVESALPLSRELESRLFDYYGWPYYWGGPYLWGPLTAPGLYPGNTGAPPPLQEDREQLAQQRASRDTHIRSFNLVNGYSVRAKDGAMGDVEDLIYDDESWQVRYIVIDTRKYLLGKNVLVPPEAVREVSWDDSSVYVDMTQDEIRNRPTLERLGDLPPSGEQGIVGMTRPSSTA